MKADHYTALVMMNELSELTIVSLVDNSQVGGLVIIIPSVGRNSDSEVVSKCREVEKYMLLRSFPCPVYFIEEDADVMGVYNALQSKSISITPSNIYTISVKFPRNTKPIALPEIRSLEGILEGFKEGVPVASLPTILITATYDSFTVAPSLSTGDVDSTIAVLEIARLFSRLYENQKTVGVYNLQFLLSSGGHADFEGFRQWMIRSSPEALSRVQFVLCLDDLSASQRLTLHLSKQPSDPELLRLLAAFTAVAQHMGIDFATTHEAVDIVREHRALPHERFALRRMMAGTLTSKVHYDAPYLTGSFFAPSDAAVLARNVRFVAEALAKFMFGLENAGEVFTGALGVEPTVIAHWEKVLRAAPRNVLLLKKDAAVVGALEAELKRVCTSVSVVDAEMDLKEEVKVFADNAGEVAVFVSKSPLFDVYTFLFVLGYLVVVYIVTAIAHEGWNAVRREIQYFLSVNLGIGKKEKEN
ncbi:hypothetical protein WA556_006323 [Blastocystis sp. ATCC 50177/Nand II]